MKGTIKRAASTCPKCNSVYTAPPAVSRVDGHTLTCPDCGTREALQSIGVNAAEQEKILAIIHRSAGRHHSTRTDSRL